MDMREQWTKGVGYIQRDNSCKYAKETSDLIETGII
jgi:hypothetical protein